MHKRFMVTGTNVQVDKDDHNKKLQDAVFTLRKLSSPEGRPEDPPEPLPSGKFPGIIVGDSQPTVKDTGKTTFTGLTHGYYEITEKIPPKGYVMTDALAIYFKIEGGKVSRIEWSSERSEWIDKGDDTMVSFTEAQIAADPNPAKNAVFTVGNTPGAALPSTGGPGTRMFYLIGALLTMLGAGMIMLRNPKT